MDRQDGQDKNKTSCISCSSMLNALVERGLALIVPKEKIAANGDYNLSGERYREGIVSLTTFPLVSLEEVFTKIGNGVNVTQVDEKAKYRVSRIQTIADGSVNLDKTKFTDDEVKAESFLQSGDILLSHINSFDHLGKTAIFLGNDADVIHGINLLRLVPDTSRIDPRYAIRVFKTDRFIETVKSFAQKAVNQASVKTTDLRAIQIPLPPLEVQKEIVAEIEGYQKVINGARAVLDNYRPHIPIHPDWPMVELGEVCDVRDGTHDSPKYVLDGYPLITSKNLKDGFIDFTDVNLISREDLDAINKRSKVDAGDLLMPMIGTIGKPIIADATREYAVKNVALIKFPKDCQMNNRFLKDVLDSAAMQSRFDRQASGSTQRFIPLGFIRKLQIPVPPLETQQAIVAEIEAEQALVAANRELIERFEKRYRPPLHECGGRKRTRKLKRQGLDSL